jgi:hypothetical protein
VVYNDSVSSIEVSERAGDKHTEEIISNETHVS